VNTLFYVAIYHLEEWYVPIIVNSVSKIAQNYWHSLHLNWKDSNFKFLPTFLILDLSVSCVSWTGPNRYKMQNTQTILYSLRVRSESGLAVAPRQRRRPRHTKVTTRNIRPNSAQTNRKWLRGQFHHSASYHLEDPRIYINIEHFR